MILAIGTCNWANLKYICLVSFEPSRNTQPYNESVTLITIATVYCNGV